MFHFMFTESESESPATSNIRAAGLFQFHTQIF